MQAPIAANPALLAIAHTLATTGWCQVTNLVPADQLAALIVESTAAWQQGDLTEARVGRGAHLQRRPEIRGDFVQWLDPHSPSPAQAPYLALLDELRVTLNQALYLGLWEFEGHLAVYPPNTRYQRHNDRHHGSEARTVTAVLYLNEGWEAADGGELRLFLPSGETVEITPQAGTLACFVTADYDHEVLPARRSRMAITGWFRLRE